MQNARCLLRILHFAFLIQVIPNPPKKEAPSLRQLQIRKHSLQNGCLFPISALFFAELLSSSSAKNALNSKKTSHFEALRVLRSIQMYTPQNLCFLIWNCLSGMCFLFYVIYVTGEYCPRSFIFCIPSELPRSIP